MAIDKEKVRQSIFDVVPRSAQTAKRREDDARPAKETELPPAAPPRAATSSGGEPLATGSPRTRPGFLDDEVAQALATETGIGFRHAVRRYASGPFFDQFLHHFIVCEPCQDRLTPDGPLVGCPGCGLWIERDELAVQVIRRVAEDLYAVTRIRRDLRWLTDTRVDWRGLSPKAVGDDMREVLTEAYVSVFAHELVKAIVQKSPLTVADFFRKYIDRIEVGREAVRIRLR